MTWLLHLSTALCGWTILLRRHGSLNDNPVLGTGTSLQVIGPENKDRLLLMLLVSHHKHMVRPYLQIYHTLWMQDIKKSSWNWPGRKLPPYWLAFVVLGDATQVAGEEKLSVVYPELTLHATIPSSRQKVPTSANSNMPVMGEPMAFCIDFRPTPQKRIYTWYCKPAHGWGGHRPKEGTYYCCFAKCSHCQIVF